MKLYFTTPGITLDFTAYAAADIHAAWKAGRLVQEIGEVKDAAGNVYVVTLTKKSKMTRQDQLFGED